MTPVRVCHIVSHVDEEASGPSYSVTRLSEAIAGTAGNEVVLATLDRGRRVRQFDRVEHRSFPQSGWPRKLGVSREMRNWLQSCAPRQLDVVHSHGLWMMPNVYAARPSRAAGIPYVVSPRGTLDPAALVYSRRVKRVFWHLAQRSALQLASGFHATSAAECADIRAAGFGQPVAVVPNGIDIPPDAPRRARAGRTLVYFGRLHPKKGLDLLLEAWAAMESRHPDWSLRIVGRGTDDYLRSLQASVSSLGLVRARIEPAVYGEDKQRLLADADLVVLPTRGENFGMVVAEALAAGVPVVTTRGAPWGGLLNRDCGWWTTPDEPGLEAALSDALTRPRESLDAMGERGRAWMREEYAWDRIASRMMEFYGWLQHGGTVPSFVHTG